MPLRGPLSGLFRVSSGSPSLLPLWSLSGPSQLPLWSLSASSLVSSRASPQELRPGPSSFGTSFKSGRGPAKKGGACPWALHREPIGLIRPAPPSSGRTTGLSKEGWPPPGARALRTGLPGRPIFGRSHGKTLPEYPRPASPAGLPSGVSPGLPSGKAPWPACCSGLLAFFSGLPQAAFAYPLGLPTRKTALFSKGGLSCDFSAA